MKKYFGLLLMFILADTNAQIFEDIRFLRDKDKIIIFYDLKGLEPGQRASIKLYSSLDNFSQPITDITGDVSNATPGVNRRIVWLAGEDFIKKNVVIEFKLKGITFQKLDFIALNSKNKVKRGKKSTVRWSGGISEKPVSIELITPNRDTIAINNIKNTGSYRWSVPKKLKTGDGYNIRLINEGIIAEQSLSIKRKMSLIWLSVPLAGIIFYVASDISDSTPALPDAPLPN